MTKVGAGVVATLLAVGAAYVLLTGTKQAIDNERPAHVTVTWKPDGAGVVIVVRVAGTFTVGGATFTKSPFNETYDVKRGDVVLVNVDPVVAGPLITCSVVVPGMPEKTNSGHGHTTCLLTVT